MRVKGIMEFAQLPKYRRRQPSGQADLGYLHETYFPATVRSRDLVSFSRSHWAGGILHPRIMTLTIGIAPDSFKGTLSATEAARAMARGVRRVYPDAEVLEMPMADGGEGTAALLAQATGGTAVTLPTTDPLGRPLEATVYQLGDTTWAVDTAAASGLTLLAPRERDPLRACSAGTGTLRRAAAGRRRPLHARAHR
jgi:hypothetical protein